MMRSVSVIRSVMQILLPVLALAACSTVADPGSQASALEGTTTPEEKAMQVQFLEIVTTDVDATCAAFEKLHGVSFSEPEAMLGNARVAALKGGGRISVRAPLADHDKPIVRPYMLVADIEASIAVAEAAGAEFAMKATEIPGQGTFAIYFLGGMQYGLWQD